MNIENIPPDYLPQLERFKTADDHGVELSAADTSEETAATLRAMNGEGLLDVQLRRDDGEICWDRFTRADGWCSDPVADRIGTALRYLSQNPPWKAFVKLSPPGWSAWNRNCASKELSTPKVTPNAEGTTVNESRVALPERKSDDIPPYSDDPKEWCNSKEAARREGRIKVETLARYRRDPQAQWIAEDKLSGIDKDGRMWRKLGTIHSHPKYYIPSLKSSKH